MVSDAILKRCVDGLKSITDMLAASMTAPSQTTRPSRPEPEEPRRKRQSELGGVDMKDLLRQAERERKSRPLPRSPEEARRTRW